VLAVAGGLWLLVLAVPSARAQSELGSFDAVAGADGVRVSGLVPGAPLSPQVVDKATPVAQALVNGLGESRAFAFAPYPGDNALSLPGTLFPLVGLPAPPSYPLMAASESPTQPESTISQPGLTLAAKSDELASTAKATVGGDAGANAVGRAMTSAGAKADRETGEVVAEAASTVESATFEGVLRIGATHATAKVVQPPTGPAKLEASFSAEGVTIAGTTVGVTDKGFVLPGSTAAVPDTSGLSPVLDQAGISMVFLEPVVGEYSVVSGGLVVTVPVALPDRDPVLTTYTFGRASASAQGVVAGVVPIDDSTDVPPTPDGSGSVLGSGSSPGAVASPSLPGPTGEGGSVVPPSAAAPAAAQRAVPMASAVSFYLVLVAAAVVAATGAVLVRLFGVRLLWTS
jgi:hypothetical protein